MSARIYIAPVGSGIRKLDLPTIATLEILDPDEREREVDVTRVAAGMFTGSWYAVNSMELKITWELRDTDTHQDWHARVASLVDWIDRGTPFGIARDPAYAGLWPVVDSGGIDLAGGVNNGSTSVRIGGDFLGWESSPALSEGDLVSLESDAPESQRHCTRLESVAAGPPVELGFALTTWGDIYGQAWVRHRNFYPYLYRREEDRGTPALIMEDRGLRFTLTLRCVQILPAVEMPS